MCLFVNAADPMLTSYGSIKAYLYSPFRSPLLWQFLVAPLHGFIEDLVTAVIAEVFILLLKTFRKMLRKTLDNTENEVQLSFCLLLRLVNHRGVHCHEGIFCALLCL